MKGNSKKPFLAIEPSFLGLFENGPLENDRDRSQMGSRAAAVRWFCGYRKF